VNWITPLAIGFMISIDVLMWVILRYYSQRGIIFAFPKSIERDRSPRWFWFNIVAGWIALGLAVAFTVVVSTLLLLDQ